ncbi:hypothetical protein RvY_02091-2 [Ramazzottius varieornatus]|uniref:Uncharacterized protein n=1 Tax=Ramazzottius varieornatus TaxID=947166 RepID=A0A1D1UT59_RAMVA|nr:hypothetical protein RvY_02091-2 [Ramazzottius varieornatus]
MRQLQIALYKHFANRSDFTTEMPSDVFCDRHDLHEYSYLNGTLQSCEFERIVEPHKLALARWWIPFAEHTTVQRRLETLLESGVKSMPHIVIFSAGLWLVRDCSSNFIPFGECMIRFERDFTFDALRFDAVGLSSFSFVAFFFFFSAAAFRFASTAAFSAFFFSSSFSNSATNSGPVISAPGSVFSCLFTCRRCFFGASPNKSFCITLANTAPGVIPFCLS